MPVKIISVLVEKRELANADVFSGNGFRLYFYTMRLLLERISWLCRDAENPGPARLIFERCKGLKYNELGEYINHLKEIGDDPHTHERVSIDWQSVITEDFLVASHDEYHTLQLADCAASSANQALELRHGHTEHRFMKILKPVVYCRARNYLSYGLKFLVRDPQIHWAEKYYT